jgi:hypothetical protein
MKPALKKNQKLFGCDRQGKPEDLYFNSRILISLKET